MKILFVYRDESVHISRITETLEGLGHQIKTLKYANLESSNIAMQELIGYDICLVCPIFVMSRSTTSRLPEKKYYISMAFDLLDEYPKLTTTARTLLGQQIDKASGIMSDSEFIRKELVKIFGSETNHLVIPYGVDIKSLSKLRKEKKEKTKVINIAALRNWDVVHDQGTILDAVTLLVGKFPDIRLHVAGDGQQRRILSSRIEQLSASGNLIDHGVLPLSKSAELLSECEIYLSSSLVDGTSVTLLEAMYLGCLCIVRNIPGNAQWIQDGESGFLFTDSLVDKLEKVIDSNSQSISKMNTIRENARERIEINANWKINSRMLSEFISGESFA